MAPLTLCFQISSLPTARIITAPLGEAVCSCISRGIIRGVYQSKKTAADRRCLEKASMTEQTPETLSLAKTMRVTAFTFFKEHSFLMGQSPLLPPWQLPHSCVCSFLTSSSPQIESSQSAADVNLTISSFDSNQMNWDKRIMPIGANPPCSVCRDWDVSVCVYTFLQYICVSVYVCDNDDDECRHLHWK